MHAHPVPQADPRGISLTESLRPIHGSASLVWFGCPERVSQTLRQEGVTLEVVGLPSEKPLAPFRTRWAEGTVEAVWVGPFAPDTPPALQEAVVIEAARIAGGTLALLFWDEPLTARMSWEERAFACQCRRHPAVQGETLCGLAERLAGSGHGLLVFEKIPQAAARAYPLESLRADRGRHRDMLRESGRRAEAHTGRYRLARRWVESGTRILDVACGSGYGAPILRCQPGVTVVGVDASRFAVEYAQAHYAAPGGENRFLVGEPARLEFADTASFDLITSFETLERVLDPEICLAEFHRVLKPTGRLILSVPNRWLDEEGRNPVPKNLHVFGFEQVARLLGRRFGVEQVYRQNAGGGWKRPQADRLEPLLGDWPSAEELADAEWWVIIARPLLVSTAPSESSELPAVRLPASIPENSGRALRLLFLDESERHAELFGDAISNLGGERLDGRGLTPEGVVSAQPDAVVLSREWTPEWRAVSAACGRAGIPVVYVMDGVLEWSYLWNNLSHIRPQGTQLQPLLADVVCVIGRHPARILASLGLGPRIEVVGLPRLDRYDRSRRVISGAAHRVLIATARTPGHDPEQQLMARRALRDLKAFFDTQPSVIPVWRIAAELAEDIGVSPNIQGSFAEALSESSALITFPSTCVLEAMLKGIPVAQIEYRAVPLYVASAWEIRAVDAIPVVIQELLYPPPQRLAWQDACLADELEVAGASTRLAEVIREAVRRRGIVSAATVTECPASVGGRLDYRQVHSELSAFSAAPLARIQYELDAVQRLLRESRRDRIQATGQAAELVESAYSCDIGHLRAFSCVDQLPAAAVTTRGHGAVSTGPATLDGRTSRTLFLGAPARAAWRLPVGGEGVFSFAASVHPDAWTNPASGPCRFLVRINGQVVLDAVINARDEAVDRKWHWFSIPVAPLEQSGNPTHLIELSAEGVEGDAYRWTIWRNPLFLWTDTTSDARGQWTLGAARLPDYYVPGRTVV